MPPATTIFTIGHSTRPIDEFVGILKSFAIELLVDVRSLPGSRRCPQFNAENLAASLAAAKIDYLHMKGLGGRRRALKDSTNNGWRNASFRGYADYMQTPEFQSNLEELIRLGRERRTAIMCAEAVPWRCHRSLVGDALLARGLQVEDLFSAGKCKPHMLTPLAKVTGETICYPAGIGLRSTAPEPVPIFSRLLDHSQLLFHGRDSIVECNFLVLRAAQVDVRFLAPSATNSW